MKPARRGEETRHNYSASGSVAIFIRQRLSVSISLALSLSLIRREVIIREVIGKRFRIFMCSQKPAAQVDPPANG